ncbi:MAG: sn-glycerol-3-phosphate ABC transporter ATP-binding protein UgpC [Candidatus Hadarchaeales archaeon]
MINLASVTLENVTKKFGQVTAVDNVSLEVKDGELVVLVGPSGCGKSTLIRMIAGLETPDEGNIYLDDLLVNDLPPKDRNVAMVFQDYALYPHMTVFENMAFALENFGYDEREIRKRVKEAAHLLGIENLLDRKPAQLSGGQRQRVALGRAIVREPKVFLWDEPLSNIDAKLRVEMRAELRKLQRRLKVTTIHVTHDQVEAMTMADRVAVMKDGRIRQFDSPEKVYSKPADEFVASFIGSPPMNFFDCVLTRKRGKLVIEAEEFVLDVPRELKDILKGLVGKELRFGIRPEDICFSTKKGGIKAKVDVVEPLGAEVLVHLLIGKSPAMMRTDPKSAPKPGEMVLLEFPSEKWHIFDRKTTKAII